ncbi:MAG: hypothetical protein AAFU65_05445 [Pseudomonadota bacterium]
MTHSTAVDWSMIFFDPMEGLSDKLMSRARRRFGDSPDAESAWNYALDQVSADDWQSLSDRYTGKGSPGGFLAITFINALEDYARQKYPRARPPEWLRRMGDLWLQVWRRLCLKREPVETIVGALDDRDPARAEEIRGATVQIRARVPNCGIVVAEEAADPADVTPTADTRTDAAAEADLVEMLLGAASAVLDRDLDDVSGAAVARIHETLELDDTDRLLIRLVYDEGLKVAAAARALDLTRKQASRRHLSLLARLRKAFEPIGLGDAS